MFEVNIRKIRTWCEICAKLTIMTSSVSMVNFEQVNAGWVFSIKSLQQIIAHDSSISCFLGLHFHLQ